MFSQAGNEHLAILTFSTQVVPLDIPIAGIQPEILKPVGVGGKYQGIVGVILIISSAVGLDAFME